MPGLTTQAMVDMLGLRLEDANADKFSDSLKLDGLNWAQLQLTNLIHPAYLTELQIKEFALSCALASGDDEGSLAYSGLANQPLTNGIQQVRINGGGAFVHMVTPEEIRKTRNSLHPTTDKHPVGYVYNERIYIAADTDTTSIDVWYLREPVSMQTQFTIASLDTAVADIATPDLDARHCVADFGTPSPAWTSAEFVGQTGYNITQTSNFIVYANDADSLSMIWFDATTPVTYAIGDVIYFTSASANVTNLASASCELNPSLHTFVVDLAENHLWRHDGQSARAKEVYDQVLSEINVRNQRYQGEAPAGIGAGAA